MTRSSRPMRTKLSVPWTIANPATVIGDLVNGESEQMLGLATTIRDLELSWDLVRAPIRQ